MIRSCGSPSIAGNTSPQRTAATTSGRTAAATVRCGSAARRQDFALPASETIRPADGRRGAAGQEGRSAECRRDVHFLPLPGPGRCEEHNRAGTGPALFEYGHHQRHRRLRREESRRWIKTFDQGSFDVSRVLVSLHKIDYQGPIGLIAYGIRGDRREILARSMKGWKEIWAKAARSEYTPCVHRSGRTAVTKGGTSLSLRRAWRPPYHALRKLRDVPPRIALDQALSAWPLNTITIEVNHDKRFPLDSSRLSPYRRPRRLSRLLSRAVPWG